MIHKLLRALLVVMTVGLAAPAGAVSSAELYQIQVYSYGRFEARIRFAAGDGVISSFFLWKPGSEMAGTFWNELDFEKIGPVCDLQTNPLYGAPVVDHSRRETLAADLCGEFHTYAFEWTPDYIAYLVDGVELRRDLGETAAAFAANAAAGMQIHFNIWPGDATFGGNFDPAIMPVHQAISWVQYSSYADGNFTLEWREDFGGGALPSGWAVGTWPSPKNLSTHAPANVAFVGEVAMLSLTADDATGFIGEPPIDPEAGGNSNASDAGAGGAMSETGEPSPGGPSTLGGDVTGNGTDMSSTATGGAAGAATAPAVGMPPAATAGNSPAFSDDSGRAARDSSCSYGTEAPSRSADAGAAFGLGLSCALALRRRRARLGLDAKRPPRRNSDGCLQPSLRRTATSTPIDRKCSQGE